MSAKTFDIADLYVSEQRRLRQLIRRLVGNRATTEDLVQQTFTKLLSAPQILATSTTARPTLLRAVGVGRLACRAR